MKTNNIVKDKLMENKRVTFKNLEKYLNILTFEQLHSLIVEIYLPIYKENESKNTADIFGKTIDYLSKEELEYYLREKEINELISIINNLSSETIIEELDTLYFYDEEFKKTVTDIFNSFITYLPDIFSGSDTEIVDFLEDEKSLEYLFIDLISILGFDENWFDFSSTPQLNILNCLYLLEELRSNKEYFTYYKETFETIEEDIEVKYSEINSNLKNIFKDYFNTYLNKKLSLMENQLNSGFTTDELEIFTVFNITNSFKNNYLIKEAFFTYLSNTFDKKDLILSIRKNFSSNFKYKSHNSMEINYCESVLYVRSPKGNYITFSFLDVIHLNNTFLRLFKDSFTIVDYENRIKYVNELKEVHLAKYMSNIFPNILYEHMGRKITESDIFTNTRIEKLLMELIN